MAHDGAQMLDNSKHSPVLGDLLALTGAAIGPAEALLARATDKVRELVSEHGKVSATRLEENQTAAHGLAWLATYVEALRQMQAWAEALDAQGKFGETEQLLQQIAFGEYLWQLYGGIPMSQGEILRPQDMGLT
ncbi:MAG: acyl-CoA dehydrogenase, partial [Pseudomonadota bacterium]